MHLKTAASHILPEEKTVKAYAYNTSLRSVFTVEDNVIPPIIQQNCMKIDKIGVANAGIFDLLLNLDHKKASGPDDIRNNF